ncbi:MAG: hypothetical protein MRZ37_04485 [Tenericutes bacterium]|nr:hypothetical protein [Mycoplasmatota bacterium]
MLDDYKDGQVIFYNVLSMAIKNNKISHAYLFENKGNDKYIEIILSFVKAILCPNNYFNNEKCGECLQCLRIENGNYPEIKIIKPEGMWIKKEQLMDLQEAFNKTAIEGSKRIYIILECEKLNKQAANSILKFLEEPNDGIIALLVTNNKDLVLDTIKSRCQDILILADNEVNFDSLMINDVLDFIRVLENKKKDTIIYAKPLWLTKFKDRNSFIKAIDIMIYFYNDVLLFKLGCDLKYFNNYYDDVTNINGSIDEIIKKIKILIENEYLIRYNLNLNLLINKIIIEFGG